MTSSNGNIFRVTGPLCGEFTGPGEFPTQRPVTRSFDVYFDLRLNKRLSKQSWGWWFETLSRSLWRQRNVYNDLHRNGLSVRIYGIRLTEWPHGHDSLITWWRHQMETFSALLAICAGNSPVTVNSLHKGQWRGALMFSLICAWMNGSVNSREADDLRRHRPHCDVTVMSCGLDDIFKRILVNIIFILFL